MSGPCARFRLGSDEVHIWTAALEQASERVGVLERTLSTEERRRAGRLRFARDRRHFVVGRGILRILLGRYLGTEPSDLEFQYGEAGRPELGQACRGGDVRFNASRSRGLALYAVTRRRRVGVDLEALRPLPDADQIARLCFSARENAVLRSLPPERRGDAFFSAWTRKEAYAKAVGAGLGLRLERIEVSLAPGKPPALLSVDGDAERARQWSLQSPPIPAGYAAALAVEGHGRPLTFRLRRWNPSVPHPGSPARHVELSRELDDEGPFRRH